jgi:heat shock protein HtpX
MTLISALLGAVVMIQIIALRGLKYNLIFGGGRRKRSKNDSGAYIMILLAAVVGLATLFSFLGRLSLLAVSRTREYFADARSVELTRNPHGLSSALRKIAGTTKKMKTASVATAHLFISDPLKRRINEKDSFFASLFSTHPPIAKRISVLENQPVEQIRKELYGRIS